jgi:hypothetical protein
MKRMGVVLLAVLAGSVSAWALDAEAPKTGTPAGKVIESGLAAGEHVPSFNPRHVAGPMKNTNACPT